MAELAVEATQHLHPGQFWVVLSIMSVVLHITNSKEFELQILKAKAASWETHLLHMEIALRTTGLLRNFHAHSVGAAILDSCTGHCNLME